MYYRVPGSRARGGGVEGMVNAKNEKQLEN